MALELLEDTIALEIELELGEDEIAEYPRRSRRRR